MTFDFNENFKYLRHKKDYQLVKLIDSPTLNYFSSLYSNRSLVLLNSRTKDTVINNTIIISTFYRNIDTVILLTRWSPVLSWVQVGYCFVKYSIVLWQIATPIYYLNFRHPAAHLKLSAKDLNPRLRVLISDQGFESGIEGYNHGQNI